MKKNLLFSLSLMLVSFGVSAQESILSVTPSSSMMSKNVSAYDDSFTLTASDKKFTVANFNNNNKKWVDGPIRCGSRKFKSVASIASDFAFAEKITKVTVDVKRFQTGTNDKLNSAKLVVSESSTFPEGSAEYTADISGLGSAKNSIATFTFDITAPANNLYYKIVFDCPQTTNNGIIGVNKFEYFGEADASIVAAPAISCTDNKVTISAGDGCDVYYTINGDDPTVDSQKYAAPFDITATVTVKAIAVKEGKSSSVTTKECKYVAPPQNYATFVEFAEAGAGTKGTVDGPITTYYQNGQNLYAYDKEQNGMLLFGSTNETYTNGDTFASVSGTYTEYGSAKTPEITNYTFGEKIAGEAIVPAVMSLDALTTEMRYKYVKVTGVEITGLSGNNFSITDGTTTIAGYNKFYKTVTVTEGTGYTIEGIVDIFKNAPEIIPTAIVGGVVEMGEIAVTAGETAVAADGTYEITVGETVTAKVDNAETVTIAAGAEDVATGTTSAVWTPEAAAENVAVTVTATLGEATKTLTFTLTIKDKPAPQPTADWERVTHADQIVAGKQYAFVNAAGTYAMSNVSNSNNRKTVGVTVENNVIVEPDASLLYFDLEQDEDGTFLWKSVNYSATNQGYLTAQPGDTNRLFCNNPQEENLGRRNTTVSITNGIADVVFVNAAGKEGEGNRVIRFNENNGSPIFNTYGIDNNFAKNSENFVCIYTNAVIPDTPAWEHNAETKTSTITAPEGTTLYVNEAVIPAEETASTFGSTAAPATEWTLVESGTHTVTAPESGKLHVKAKSVSPDGMASHLVEFELDSNGTVTGIEAVSADENAPVEYFNLQGVRVLNPENGFYIRRQGTRVEKVVLR